MNFEQGKEFSKELKKLSKKWRSLSSDLHAVEKQIISLYADDYEDASTEVYRSAFFNGKRAALLRTTEDGAEVIKMRLYSSDLKSNSKIRLIIVVVVQQNKAAFIELYSKSDKESQNDARIEAYLDFYSD